MENITVYNDGHSSATWTWWFAWLGRGGAAMRICWKVVRGRRSMPGSGGTALLALQHHMQTDRVS